MRLNKKLINKEFESNRIKRQTEIKQKCIETIQGLQKKKDEVREKD